MSAERNWKLRVKDILTCIEKIRNYTDTMTFEQFQKDDKTIDAVIRNLEKISEAASHIPLEIQEKYSNLGWFEMRGMRNIMTHEYFGVSIAIVWRAIHHDLPSIVKEFNKLLQD